MKSQLLERGIIPAVNFHLWKSCNFKCKFCFGSFNDVHKNNLHEFEAKQLIQNLVNFGFEKITFSGGEPTLCKFLPKLLDIAKKGGMTTMIVTNGSKLKYEWLKNNQQHLDWIAISIDSLISETNLMSGRSYGKNVFNEHSYLTLIALIQEFNYKIKINTVVSKFNHTETMNEFINKVKPERWKVMQALPILGQNERFKDEFSISINEFNQFVIRHNKENEVVKESNYQMKGSYVMIDPIGRFFSNATGKHTYSSPINDVGVEQALTEINYCFKKFINRGGIYDWK